MLVLEFESRRGEILNVLAKIISNVDQLLSAPSVGTGQTQFDASRRGKKELRSSRDKNARHVPESGGGRRACYVTPDLSDD